MSDALQRQKETKGVLEYGGQEYAVGLLWLSADEEEDAKTLKKRAATLHADFYAVRDTVIQQNGFGFLEQGHKRRLQAGAAVAADVLVGEWHGVFKAANGWWYVAVHADSIAPDGDVLFEEEADAYQHFMQALEDYRWPRSFVPESWEFKDNVGEVTLDKVFDEIPGATLQPANLDAVFGGKRNKDVAVILGAILCGIMMLATLASQILPSLLPSPKQAPQVQVAAADILKPPPKASDIEEEINPVIKFGTFSLPIPSYVVVECMQAMEDIVHPLPLWRLDQVRCDGRLATALWSSQGGDLDSIRPNIGRFGSGITHTYDGTGSFTATRLLDSLNDYMQQIVPMDRDRAILLVNDRFGDLGQLKVDYKVPTTRLARSTVSNRDRRRRRSTISEIIGSEKEEKPPFLEIELITKTPATKISEFFNIPGLSFKMIQYELSTGTWKYQANITLRTGG